MQEQEILLEVKDLKIAFKNQKEWREVVHGISFSIGKNEILGLVGESGSGKSISSLALMGLLPQKNTKIDGEVLFENKNLLEQDTKVWRNIRANEIAMIFQEPMSALNPSMRCGKQVAEVLIQHKGMSKKAAKAEVLQLFEKVKLPQVEKIYKSYPHEISGGQMQRVVIAIAIACKPKLLIADEPTTALDVTVQKEILKLLKDIQAETKMGMLFISHDLNVVSQVADTVMVLYKGQVVEYGSKEEVFQSPKHHYTQALLASRPSDKERLRELPTIQSIQDGSFQKQVVSQSERVNKHKELYTQEPLLEIKNLVKNYRIANGLFKKDAYFTAVNQVNFSLYPDETLGLVGESGCGKSSLAKAIIQLEPISEGSIWFRGQDVSRLKGEALKAYRKEVQLIFQDPFASLNPKICIGDAILEPMQAHSIGKNKAERIEKVKELLVEVGLDATYYERYPHQLSGGQRQRVGIARAIAVNPKLIICDESVAALDISVQAQVLNLLNNLKEHFGFSYLFISHDLAVVKYMSDQLMVMNKGKIEEIGDADEICAYPKKNYTKKLIDSIPKSF